MADLNLPGNDLRYLALLRAMGSPPQAPPPAGA
ncbi:MAG: hypothetical protein ACI8PQ_003508, partial [Planctomycetota bacterium]